MSGYRAIGPQSETVIGGVVSTGDFLSRGYQVDLEMLNLDTAIQKIARDAPTSLDAGAAQTWNALKASWDSYFQANVQKPPILPLTDDSELGTWLDRIAEWKKKVAGWAARSGNANLQGVVAAIPSSPAAQEQKEAIASGGDTSLWFKLGFATALLLGAGWLASSVAKVAR